MTLALSFLVGVTVVMIAMVARHPTLVRSGPGKALAFVALFVLPVAVTGLGAAHHLEEAKSTDFCVSCHVMEPYGESLYIDDSTYLPAVHFQDNLTPRDQACFTCHTNYSMFGGMKAKMNGLVHVWKYYVAGVPETIELYEPYQNRECLHCHGESRSFVEGDLHVDMMNELRANEVSCLDCHDLVHAVEELDSLDKWQGVEEVSP